MLAFTYLILDILKYIGVCEGIWGYLASEGGASERRGVEGSGGQCSLAGAVWEAAVLREIRGSGEQRPLGKFAGLGLPKGSLRTPY